MTKVIGLTGGIGSGKTLVANYIRSKGIPVYIADEEAKKIMETQEVVQLVETAFGDSVISDKKIDRTKLAQLVFNSPEKLQKLNTIIHPIVKQNFDIWLKNHQNFPFVIKEAAILFESGSYKYCDSIITITAPFETRLQRVIDRDKTDRESVLSRMKNQWSEEQKIAKSHFVIHNISVEDTKNQVDNILNLLKNQQY
ncbi:dephospho-CoA kinase [Flavobacterium sp. J49]|uniref:dephospho-CoA kinase n=1 Tax=Flavobacterium sp. J49 TaxID=2718534 RepID=UPI001594A7DF|nr:dephospho-CoA kinase [Flavobacterium sp. J49]MBF6640742.1 dephospho-CoA kinase [Flavobacterium sp. J49]NIC01989.1 dephospho-CoA kinase [Flavobacterium sp. J49]